MEFFQTVLDVVVTAILNTIKFKKPLRSVLILGLIALALYLIVTHKPAGSDADTAVNEPVVKIASAGDINNESSFSAVGTVESVSEAQLKIETGGQVKSVSTDIGKNVQAGAVLAQVENARESAALLQAQGAYEAAIAGASQSNSGTRDAEIRLQSAKDALRNTIKNSYSTENTMLITSIDTFFSNPDSGIIGLRISGDTVTLNNLRVDFRTVMPEWQTSLLAISDSNLPSAANLAKENTAKMLRLVDGLTKATSNTSNPGTLNGAELSTFTPDLLANRTTLNGVMSGIENAEAGVQTAEEGLARAKVSGTGGGVSLSGAQIKIALGSLRSAQASFEKTIIRTPISGVVNAFYLKKGDYVSPGQDAALIANNNGLQVSTYVNLEDRDLVTIGDSVSIEGTATGTVTAIAGAVDPKNGKVGVKVAINANSGLTNGTAVKITFKKTIDAKPVAKQMVVPISAVKLSSEGPQVFTLDGESKLVAKAVKLGDVVGDSVIVLEGIDMNTTIVLDVRGLKAGTKVTVATK